MWYGNHIGRGTLLLALALVSGTGSGAAQCCQPRLGLDEVAAGAGGNAVLRGPWVTAAWRKPLPRLVLFTLGSFTYERFVDHGGWSPSDFNQRLASYLFTEAMVTGVGWLRRKLARPRAPTPSWNLCVGNPPPGAPSRPASPCDPPRRR